MVQLTASSLSKRQQELNTKVNEAAAQNVNFQELISEPETCDVDRLFKIDIAAKQKNVDYIIETFKSGDSLYISRALKKALWLYDDEYSSIINSDYLHHNIFPFMSSKMKKKLISALALHLKNKDQIADFYNYCLQAKMNHYADKFLINLSEGLKLKWIQENAPTYRLDSDKELFLKSFLNNSFVLFEAFLNNIEYSLKKYMLIDCSYFYTISQVLYLDLLEKHISQPVKKLGLRISKDIVTKHKNRVLTNPKLYVSILNVKMLLRHSNSNNAKIYAVAVLPNSIREFWSFYYRDHKPIIETILESERYEFVKKIFVDKYSCEEFEMTNEFYNNRFYELMTSEEKEVWALRHLASGKEMLGAGCNYKWYRYVGFETAFEEIKKNIRTTTDHTKRLDLLRTLANTPKNQREIQKLLIYYYERHINEKRNSTQRFLREVESAHNIFEFDTDCWNAFDKILYSVDVYNGFETQSSTDFKIMSIVYHILNNIDMPEVLKKYLAASISMYSIKQYVDKLDDEKKQHLYEYVLNFYTDRIQKYTPGSKDDLCIINIHFALEFMAVYKKSMEDIPSVIMEFVNSDYTSFRYQQILKKNASSTEKYENISDENLVRYLKKDVNIVTEKVPEVKAYVIKNHYYCRLNKILRKLKIYFSGDHITQEYLKLFNSLFNEESPSRSNVAVAVYGILRLSDEKSTIAFMNKYAPNDPKIDHKTIDPNLLAIREAICRFSCYCRPPVPLSSTLMYLKCDYVKYCLPMFNMYLANLPQPLFLKFVEALLDTPVSIQKHGLRLAFECFSAEHLNNLVLIAWKGTKNVSLRGIIYKALIEKILQTQDKKMYDTLKELTLDLHDDDDESIFSLITSNKQPLPERAGDFVEAVWSTVEKLKCNEQNISRKTAVINLINERIHLINKNVVEEIVSDYVNTMFDNTKTLDPKLRSLNVAKWDLVAHYIKYYCTNEEDRSEILEMTKLIIDKFIESWNDVTGDIYVCRSLYAEFIENLKNIRYLYSPDLECFLPKAYENETVVVLEAILNQLQEHLPLNEIYMCVWDLKVSIIYRKLIKEIKEKIKNDNRVEVFTESVEEYGKKLGNLVKDFVQNKTYFSSFANDIAKLIMGTAEDMKRMTEIQFDLHTDHILVGIVRGLLETGIAETNSLALQLLPTDPNCDLHIYNPVYVALQSLPDMEIQCYFQQKFSGDFKRRRFN